MSQFYTDGNTYNSQNYSITGNTESWEKVKERWKKKEELKSV